ncbi:TPA: LysR family transcriptional regulator [Burkholderia cepacia ATCC 25416]|uniref:LysR family transcriptional regulator n=1 Tax=Burkholderia cepacia TaxID=292 RepID=UPI001CF1FEF4|nr:LysR family transcriptional regulator [Burkholderia cepacia]HDR9767009.1 LysR family transcriptional regulator [Burkholderia cepacia ATCC 25416]MCA8080923.1 LysR family transcriptional regulator [Burkholderia cepacia]HDR9774114.1 LysR family transcriptional regulator [Burkholderia cepacia ATCC 25416]HDR9783072.1 LysR family transcriptional regulator [Burkholderia cepacia ATCC 25416]HDR9790341.1 LysR family transcriptional regulator [Burkholderia cepacia ATCC 25416]
MQRVPSLKLLTGFEAAARLGNFSRAADELHLSQSAISHQIQQLEAQLGQPLFRRRGRGVELTIAGEVLQRSVQRAMDTLRGGLDRIATYLNPGLVVLVCPAPLLHGWLQPRLEQLQQALPDLCPLLSTDETARYVDEIDVDMTIGTRPMLQPGLVDIPFMRDEWVMVCATPLAETLARVPRAEHARHAGLVCLETSLTDERMATVFREQLSDFRMQAIYDDQRLVLDAVQRGRGIACLPRLVAQAGLDQHTLTVLADYPRLPGTTWWLSRMEGPSRSPIVEQMFDWLVQQGILSSVADPAPDHAPPPPA